MAQVVGADEAIRQIPDGATVLACPLPLEEVFPAFARVFEEGGSPKDLTVVWAAGLGPFSEERKGMNHFEERVFDGIQNGFGAGRMMFFVFFDS